MDESFNFDFNTITVDTCSMIDFCYAVQCIYVSNRVKSADTSLILKNVGNLICDIIKSKISNPRLVSTSMATGEFGFAPYQDIKDGKLSPKVVEAVRTFFNSLKRYSLDPQKKRFLPLQNNYDAEIAFICAYNSIGCVLSANYRDFVWIKRHVKNFPQNFRIYNINDDLFGIHRVKEENVKESKTKSIARSLIELCEFYTEELAFH